MRIAILQSNYIPWKGYFDMINSVDVFVLYDEVQYTKNDWRNRNIIKTRNGKEWITIPVRQKSLSQRIDETEVLFNNWNVKHWNTIKTNYGKAPFFNELKDYIENLYLSINTTLLSEINRIFILAIAEYLNIRTRIIDSKELNLQGDRNERLIDACKKLNATEYLSGPAAGKYLDTELFRASNIQVEWMSYTGYSEYPQLFPPFEAGVSILDVLLNTGKQSSKFIQKQAV